MQLQNMCHQLMNTLFCGTSIQVSFHISISWHIYWSWISCLKCNSNICAKKWWICEMQLQKMCHEMMWLKCNREGSVLQPPSHCGPGKWAAQKVDFGGTDGGIIFFKIDVLWSLRGFLDSLRGICRESQGVSEVLFESLGIWVVLKGVLGGFKGPQGRVKWFPDNHQTDWHKRMIILW